jgi:pimeloyl-ACP methyl ester carboxylesterase
MISQQFTALQQAQYQRAWRQPGAIEGMLSYYRAMPRLVSPVKGEAANPQELDSQAAAKIPNIRIELPTLILWGEQDEAFTMGILNGIEEYVPDCQIHRYADASHWLHHEHPERVNRDIANFINHVDKIR